MVENLVVVDFVESRSNLYNVPEKQWRKWGPEARQVFNEVYSSMQKSKDLFLHPMQGLPSKVHWRTTCWNAAWTAGEAAQKVS